MTTRIILLNRALLRIGAVPVQSDAAPSALQHVAVYDSVIERLAAHPWSFLRQTRRLARLAAVPQRYKYAYQLPTGDMLGPLRAVYDRAPATLYDQAAMTDYDIEGDQVLCDAEQVWVTFTAAGNPERWPGDFRELVQQALMAELALSVREDRPLHDRLYQKAFGSPAQNGMGGLLSAALENDSQSIPSGIVGNGINPLVDVRW